MKKTLIYSVGLVVIILILYLLAINAASLFMHNLFLILALIILIADLIYIVKMIQSYRNDK